MGPQQLPMLTDQQGRAPASGVAALSQSRKALPRQSGIGLIDWTLPAARFRQPMRRFDNGACLTQIDQPTRAITWKGSSQHISKNFARRFRRWLWEQQVIRGSDTRGDVCRRLPTRSSGPRFALTRQRSTVHPTRTLPHRAAALSSV